MWILLVVAFLIPLVYIGYLVSKLDMFLAQEVLENNNDKAFPVAIVLGETDLAKQIVKLLEKNRIQVLHITGPFLFKQEQNLQYLFALSENDADNIVLCEIGMKVYGIKDMISICNDRKDEGMFINEKIRYLLKDKVTVQILYNAVIQDAEVKL